MNKNRQHKCPELTRSEVVLVIDIFKSLNESEGWILKICSAPPAPGESFTIVFCPFCGKRLG